MKPHWTHLAALVAGFIIGLLIRGCGPGCVTETVTTSDTLYVDTGRVVFTEVPEPYEVIRWRDRFHDRIDTLFVHDTAAFVEDCLLTRNYFQSYDTNEVKIGLHVSVFSNRLDSLRIEVANVRPTVINTTINNPRRRLGIDLVAGYGFTPAKFQPYVGVGIGYRLVNLK